MDTQCLHIRTHGALSFVEGMRDIPFEIKRVYYIHSEKAGAHRGCHAHKTLNQFLFCPSGSVLILLDDGNNKTEVLLDDPAKGLLLPQRCWHEMIWNEDHSVLCVLASDYYDESDYIRDYDAFLAFVKD